MPQQQRSPCVAKWFSAVAVLHGTWHHRLQRSCRYAFASHECLRSALSRCRTSLQPLPGEFWQLIVLVKKEQCVQQVDSIERKIWRICNRCIFPRCRSFNFTVSPFQCGQSQFAVTAEYILMSPKPSSPKGGRSMVFVEPTCSPISRRNGSLTWKMLNKRHGSESWASTMGRPWPRNKSLLWCRMVWSISGTGWGLVTGGYQKLFGASFLFQTKLQIGQISGNIQSWMLAWST